MSRHIAAHDNGNRAIVNFQTENTVLKRTYFNLVRLSAGESFHDQLEGIEIVLVVMSGRCTITAGGETFTDVGGRKNVWEGKADSVYCPQGVSFEIICLSENCEIAVGGGASRIASTPFRITPDEVDMVDVGSGDTHSRRRIFHILGQNAAGRAGNLLVSELYADPGCWSGYPPHKHDEKSVGESAHEEVYHFRFSPETGFGGQFLYTDEGPAEVFKTGNGSTVLIEGGYHPTVTSPGHAEYIFTILVGRDQRGLVQNFEERHEHLTDTIPGLGAMRDKFK